MSLPRYVARRLGQSVFTLLGVVTITFLLVNAAPGDPVRIFIGPSADASAIAAMRAQFGLDQPIHIRYIKYLMNVVQGDLGQSINYRVPVTQKILERLPATLLLVASSFTFAIITAVPIGVLSAQRRNQLSDHVFRIFGLIGVSTPSFWIGLLLIIILTYHLGLLPATGLVMPWAPPSAVDHATTRLDVLYQSGIHLIMPTLTLGTLQMAAIMRIERSSMLEVLNQEYVSLARAFGVSERTILRKHAFRNAQLPVLTVIGLNLTTALGGSVLTETVFSINGIGTLIITGVNARDYPLVLGTTLFYASLFVIGVLITDILYAYLDPRISYGDES
ncbi:ABC transporter permease [Halobellus clavatus]|jgi:peptide/nickel transport system permease protein|uniref:Peptide/nickel transport system permease protein n=1 Tax=Halobellus clavatus TaxID=660517 RepID=A0A1H3I6A8_9EURY|nr:ABC transporter permease [Halobellus clavatus]SDY23243.1 peptide/nickel transport system permease protein [Halobellus clavatus]